jgi:hypothetical protein
MHILGCLGAAGLTENYQSPAHTNTYQKCRAKIQLFARELPMNAQKNQSAILLL